jgi:hypothetical protein
MVKQIAGILVLISLLMIGCKDSPNAPVEENIPSSFKELKPDAGFTWNTASTISLSVQGFETVTPISRTLYVYDDAGTLLYKQLMSLSDNVTLSINLPAVTSSLKVKFGSIERTAVIAPVVTISLASTGDNL